MNTRVKLFVWGLLIVVVAGSLTAVVVRQGDIAALRAEHQNLLSDGQEAERLARENQDIATLRAQNEEVAKLRVENKDLPKLRNEVRQLRKQLEEMAKLRAENERLMAQPSNDAGQGQKNIMAANGFTKDSLRDVGMGLPILTLQTFFAALSQGNVNRATECLTPESAARLQAASKADGHLGLLQIMNGFTGYQITDRNQPSPDEIVLQVKLTGTGVTQDLHFKQVGNQWKMNP
ncbi:MAG TPA: hypothetical protein VFC07_10365 [Verrucomicrobiae bacterium]|nr:hypothetical protein [Verrucomicrobiae bacterium]